MSRRNWLLFAAMCVVWGIPYLLIRIAVRDVTPGTLVFLRTGIGGLILAPLALRSARGRGGFGLLLRHWRAIVAFSAIEMGGPWLLLSSAEQHLSSSLTGLLIAGVPLVALVVTRLLGAAEHTSGAQLLGLAVGIVGVGLLVGLDVGELSVGALFEVALVAVGYAIAPVIMARHLADLPRIPVVCASLLLVAAAYLPYAVLRWPSGLSGQQVGVIAVLGTVCTALAFVLFFALISGIGPSRALVITYVNPAVALAGGVLLLGEAMTLGMALGFPLILLGSVLAARRRDRIAPPGDGAQSIRTAPEAVSNAAATTPASSSPGVVHSTPMPSSG